MSIKATIRRFFASSTASASFAISDGKIRNMTDEEKAALDEGFREMDRAFDAMGRAFDKMGKIVK